MINSNPLPTRSALLALACAFSLTLVAIPSLPAADTAAPKPVAANKAPSLPLTATFSKVTVKEGAPFVLKLKNDSKVTLKVSAKILLSVVNHAMDKARLLPEHAIEAGQVWTITDLASDDKVVVTAAGFAPLELKVPFKG